MSLEVILIIVVALSICGVILSLAVARRAVRLAVRMGLAFALVLVLGAAALVWYWFGQNPSTKQTRPANTRRSTGSR